jgi:hypothetical protein
MRPLLLSRRGSLSVPPLSPGSEYTYRFASFNQNTDMITGSMNRFQPAGSWWVPGAPDGTPWPDGGGIHLISHPTYGPGFDLYTTAPMIYVPASSDSCISRIAMRPWLIDPLGSRLRYLQPGSRHTWEATIMRPSGFTWSSGSQYEDVWEYAWTNNGFDSVGHHIFLNYNYHWSGFSYYFGHQFAEPVNSPPTNNLWNRYNCPIPFNTDEYHTVRWEILHSSPLGASNGSIKCWTSVNGGAFQQWLNLTNIVTLHTHFSENYHIYSTLRTPRNSQPMSLRIYNMRVLIA